MLFCVWPFNPNFPMKTEHGVVGLTVIIVMRILSWTCPGTPFCSKECCQVSGWHRELLWGVLEQCKQSLEMPSMAWHGPFTTTSELLGWLIPQFTSLEFWGLGPGLWQTLCACSRVVKARLTARFQFHEVMKLSWGRLRHCWTWCAAEELQSWEKPVVDQLIPSPPLRSCAHVVWGCYLSAAWLLVNRNLGHCCSFSFAQMPLTKGIILRDRSIWWQFHPQGLISGM